MNVKLTIIIAISVLIAFAPQSKAVMFNFQENGSNVDLGPTSTFTEGGFSVTASAFLTGGAATHLYAKNEGPTQGRSEIGLGTTADLSGEHEITVADFIQLVLPPVPNSNVELFFGSVQPGESALVYFTHTPGTLVGATLIGTVANEDGSVSVLPQYRNGFIDVTAASGNVLLGALAVGVPDGGTTLLLLGISLVGIGLLRRRLCQS